VTDLLLLLLLLLPCMSIQATLKSATGESWTFESAKPATDDAPAHSVRELLACVADVRKNVNTQLSTLVAQDCAGVEKRRRVNADTVAAADDDEDDDAVEDDDEIESNGE
jgi:hypothetical protein